MIYDPFLKLVKIDPVIVKQILSDFNVDIVAFEQIDSKLFDQVLNVRGLDLDVISAI